MTQEDVQNPSTPQTDPTEAPTLEADADVVEPVEEVPLTPEQRIEALEAQVAENYDLYVRAMAEQENIRRRAMDDIAKARKFSIESFAEQLLPVVDSLEKALDVAKEEANHPLYEGMQATYRQLIHSLDIAGMKPIEDDGTRRFDPHKHQAVMTVPAPEGVKTGEIVAVFQKGWMIHDRVLRPAMVSVAQ